MTLQATETLQNGPFKGIFDEDGAFVGFLNPRANGADLRIGGYAPVSGSFTTLTVSGTSTLGVTRVSGADGGSPPQFGVSGTSKGVRIVTTAGAASIEGVDNTLVGSYQPLNVIATTLGLYTTGGGNVQIGTGSNLTQFSVTHTASAVNYFQVTGAPTTGQPGLISTGTDANVSSAFSTKGTGYHYFSTNSFADVQFVIASVPSAVNRLQVQGGTAGFGPTIYVDGADTNTQLTISSKGTGSVLISTNTAGSIALQALHVASAVNWVRVQGSATGVASFVSVQGADTNASIVVAAKGSGAVGLYTGGGVNPQVLVAHTASAVNYLNFTGAATGNAVTISTGGSDTNRRIAVTAGGTEGVLLGNATNGSIVGIGSYSGAEKTIYILNTTAAPTSNPPGGGYLYCEGGALKYRGSAGTVTTIAAA